MAKRKTNEQFLKEIYDLVENEYTFLEDYKTSKEKLKVRHNECGREYEVTPEKFLAGRRCATCNHGLKKSNEKFLKEVYEQVKDEYIFLEKYVNNRTKIKVIHNICGNEYEVCPDKFLNAKRRCPKCFGTPKKTNEQFIKEVLNIVGNEYVFIEDYIDSHTPIKVKHNKCNYEYKVSPTNFLQGGRCSKCYGGVRITNEEFLDKIKILVGEEYTFLDDYINNHTKIKIRHNICSHEYEVQPKNFTSTNQTRCPKCARNNGVSKLEKELLDYIKSILPNKEIIENDRTILNGKEIDILIPSKNIGVEFDGLYWHSSKHKDKKFHLEKTLLAKEKNIQLIHIFEDEWNDKQELIKKKISHLLNVNKDDKIYARKCYIQKIIKISDKTQFLNETHIQGADRSNFSYGLYYEDELVALMSFIKPRINMGRKDSKEGEYELSRYSTKYNVVGGFGKLLKHIIKNEDVKEIYTYADLRWTNPNNNVYLKNGFEYISTSEPNYWYIINDERKSRFNYQKGKLKELFPDIYDDNKTEEQIMLEADYYRIYDCGNLKYKFRTN